MASTERDNGDASTSAADSQPEAPKGYQVGHSITSRFNYDAITPPTAEEMAMQDAFHNNCLIRSLMSGVAGGVMGVAFGIFMGAMDPGSMSSPAPLAGEKQRTAMQVLKETYTTTKARSISYSKSFATIGLLYAGIECVIEKHRGKHDWYNSLYTGFATGGLLARGSGLMTMGIGAVSFAAFSVAMDRFMGFH